MIHDKLNNNIGLNFQDYHPIHQVRQNPGPKFMSQSQIQHGKLEPVTIVILVLTYNPIMVANLVIILDTIIFVPQAVKGVFDSSRDLYFINVPQATTAGFIPRKQAPGTTPPDVGLQNSVCNLPSLSQ